jgi:hypothetical protein
LVKAIIAEASLLSTCQKKEILTIPGKNDAIPPAQPQPCQTRAAGPCHGFNQWGIKLGATLFQKITFLAEFIPNIRRPLLGFEQEPSMKFDLPTMRGRLRVRRLQL